MAHYYDEHPEVESDVRSFQFDMEGRTFEFLTDRGVFSKGGLDIGSKLLLRTAIADMRDDPAGETLLDLGCGYGVLGLVLKRVFPKFKLTMVDVNERALDLARQNAIRNDVRYATVISSDGFSNLADTVFDVIVTNPPIRAGKATVYRFFDDAKEHLSSNGRLYVVIGKKQGAPSAERHLQEVFGNCRRLAREKGFWILRCDR
ncbi:MAG: class I SAM-dependent methyltransferase [Fastidiosipilaceae bacterium]|jgi:16S rRNA (guanine1207-N2)-methyltransferase|nr:class I SAM-dependent methyltransferase [Clostridiaceae bacterium]